MGNYEICESSVNTGGDWVYTGFVKGYWEGYCEKMVLGYGLSVKLGSAGKVEVWKRVGFCLNQDFQVNTFSVKIGARI